MTKQEMEALLGKIKFLNFKFEVDCILPEGVIIRLISYTPDNNNREVKSEMTSFHHISIEKTLDHAIFVKAIFDATLEKMRHEASELFFFSGKTIFNEHYSLTKEQRLEMIRTIIDI